MIRTILVDDEPLVIQMIKDMLEEEKDIDIIGEYYNPKEALSHIVSSKPDLVFLDIDMPGMNGIELATEVLNKEDTIRIVFLTAYDQYAVEAFKLNAMHYILKPPSHKELQTAIERLETSVQAPYSKTNKTYIRFLGEISICDEEGISIVKWRTAKAEELFALLMLSGEKGIEKWRIIETLWPEAPCSEKSEQLLYSTIYRVKSALTQAGIKSTLQNRLGIYYLSIEDMWCDLYELEKWYKKMMKNKFDDNISEMILEIYKGELFFNRDYAWSMVYRSNAFKMTEELYDLCEEKIREKGDFKMLETFKEKRKMYLEA